jgi:ADP-ribose pyrophosphatase
MFPLELVAGKVDPGETTDIAARREVMEEVGVEARELVPIASIYPSPGVISEMVSIYYAEFEGSGCRTPDTDEEGIEFVWHSRLELEKLHEYRAIRDAKTLVAVQWLRGRS